MAVVGTIWILLLFYAMSIAAETFLCPAIEYLAVKMKMSPDTAGVTLFAFASGAPDLFTQVAAVVEGNHVDMDLAVSSTFGGGLFIICLVLATVIWTSTHLIDSSEVGIQNKRAFIRDVVAYTVANVIALGTFAQGRLGIGSGVSFLIFYSMYIAICMVTRTGTLGEDGGHGEPKPSELELGPLSPRRRDSADKAQVSRSVSLPASLSTDTYFQPPDHLEVQLPQGSAGSTRNFSFILSRPCSESTTVGSAFRYLTAPLHLAMHATMPALHHGDGTVTLVYGGVVSVCAPLFFLLTTFLTPSRLGLRVFILGWLISASILFILVWWLPPPPLKSKLVRPQKSMLFAAIAFINCMLWLNATADEVVALLECLGRGYGIREDVLGATLLAVGETFPDLVAVRSLVKSQHLTMALAACFGGPVFNLLVSMGGPILIATLHNGPISYTLSSGTVSLVLSTLTVLAVLLVAIPFGSSWKLSQSMVWLLLLAYSISQIAFLMVEGIIPWKL
jgi:sodium/potassium/calcium exchanger 6